MGATVLAQSDIDNRDLILDLLGLALYDEGSDSLFGARMGISDQDRLAPVMIGRLSGNDLMIVAVPGYAVHPLPEASPLDEARLYLGRETLPLRPLPTSFTDRPPAGAPRLCNAVSCRLVAEDGVLVRDTVSDVAGGVGLPVTTPPTQVFRWHGVGRRRPRRVSQLVPAHFTFVWEDEVLRVRSKPRVVRFVGELRAAPHLVVCLTAVPGDDESIEFYSGPRESGVAHRRGTRDVVSGIASMGLLTLSAESPELAGTRFSLSIFRRSGIPTSELLYGDLSKRSPTVFYDGRFVIPLPADAVVSSHRADGTLRFDLGERCG